jgi:hypothetical protein
MGKTSVRGKSIIINNPAYLLYSAFADMNNLVRNLPEEKKKEIKTTEDTIEGTVQGFSMGLKIIERNPFSSIKFEQYGNSPFKFNLVMFFDAIDVSKTDFHIELEAELNFLLKSMLGNKLQDLVDQITDQLASAINGGHNFTEPDMLRYN